LCRLVLNCVAEGLVEHMPRIAFIMSGRDFYRELAVRARDELGVVPVMWLGDQRHVGFARDEFGPRCFAAGYADFMAGKVDSESVFTSPTLEEYERLISSQVFRTWEPLLLQELNRESTLRFVRTIDREVFLRRLILSLLDKYRSQKPDLLFSSETPHDVVCLAAFYIAKWLEIPTLFFQPTSTIGPNLVARSDLDRFFDIPPYVPGPQSVLARRVAEFRESFAQLSLDKLSRGAAPARMEAELDKESAAVATSSKRRFVLKGRTNSSVFHYRQLRRTLRLLGLYRGGTEWEGELGRLLYASWQKSFRDRVRLLSDEIDMPEAPYAVFPLHYQPERTSIPEGSWLSFQGDVVAQARAILPADITLIVKEHASQVSLSRSGYLARSSSFYDLVNSFPNTKVVGVGWNLSHFLGAADYCFTMTGSVGVEAGLQGVPVVYFGNPWWEGMPGSTKFTPGMPVLERRLKSGRHTGSGPASVRDFLVDLVANRSIPGFGTPSQQRFWSNHLELPQDFATVELDSTIAVLEKFLLAASESNV